jgi:hypothetical protein
MKRLTWLALAVGLLIIGSSLQAAVRVTISSPASGPPFYAAIARPPSGQIFQDEEWAAIPFLRDPVCVAADSNLLDGFDLRALNCALTIGGFAIFKNGPSIDPVPVFVLLSGNGAVPIWFVRWPELQAAIADDELTIGELLSSPSLLMGSASFFEYVNQIGVLRPQGEDSGKIEASASGVLTDGRDFQFSVREMGVDQISTLRHIKIQFR